VYFLWKAFSKLIEHNSAIQIFLSILFTIKVKIQKHKNQKLEILIQIFDSWFLTISKLIVQVYYENLKHFRLNFNESVDKLQKLSF
jgi:hypothetical protein